jgi:hypothetical protein
LLGRLLVAIALLRRRRVLALGREVVVGRLLSVTDEGDEVSEISGGA